MSTVPASKRGPYSGSKRRREEISSAVLDLIDEVGHENLTTAAVAARAEISEATVLYHFPTKDHLMVSALERADEINVQEWHAVADGDFLDLNLLRDIAAGISEQNENRVRLLAMLRGQAATPGHPAASYFTHRMNLSLEIYERLIRERQRRGFVHPAVDPADVAAQLLALWEGLTSMWILDRNIDVASLLIGGYLRIAGENWMNAQRAIVESFDV